MRAYVLNAIDEFNILDRDLPEVGPGEVLMEVKAAGICGSDIPRIYRTGTYHYPLIPGHEFAGEVVKTSTEDSEYRGRRFGVFPLIPCMKCQQCKMKRYEMCEDYSYLGSRTDGGFAEYVKVPVWNLIELPDTVTYEQAAMLEPMSVAVHAMRRAGLAATEESIARADDNSNAVSKTYIINNANIVGETNKADDAQAFIPQNYNVFDSACELNSQNTAIPMGQISDMAACRNKRITVMGLGTIGMSLVMMLMSEGYKNITAVGKKNLQKETALALGLPESCYVDINDYEPKKYPAEVFFDCVGTADVVSTALKSVVPAGKICLVGNPASDINIERTTYWAILRRQLTLIGTWNSSYTHDESDDWHYVINKLSEGTIHPELVISHRYDFDGLIDGFALMRDKSEEYIKVMMTRE